jgi:2-polyprenyl-3-methyl-5-hydroxy-6-metoxy-1,4-benzoquinol methylase
MEQQAKREDTPTALMSVRRREDAERSFFAGYYAERRYHPTGWRLRSRRDLRVLCAAVKNRPLGRVLSIGCGDGTFELMLAQHADSVLGVDISPEAIAVAERAKQQAGVTNLDFRCLSIVDLELAERFDTIVCVAFLHHLPVDALEYFLTTTYERLKPGGVLYTQDPNVHGILRYVGRRVLGQSYDTFHSKDERELDPQETMRAIAAAGFANVTLRYVDLTLIPALYYSTHGADVLFHLSALLDRLWCASPLAPWASGFAIVARKAGVASADLT